MPERFERTDLFHFQNRGHAIAAGCILHARDMFEYEIAEFDGHHILLVTFMTEIPVDSSRRSEAEALLGQKAY